VVVLDLKILGGHIVDSHNIYEADLLIDEGVIKGILKDASSVSTEETINAERMLIMPGVIDAHVHFWDPGYTQREDWHSGTESAAAGGVTTVIDMPTTSSPPTTTVESFEIKKHSAEKKAIIDYGFHAGATPDTIEEIPKLAKMGVASFKMLMHETTREMKKVETIDMVKIFQLLSENKRVGTVHAEDPMVTMIKKEIKEKRAKDPIAHSELRPKVAEAIAVYTAVSLSREFNAYLHVAHVSAKESVAILQNVLGQKVTAETCPHYLLFTKEDMKRLGPYLKVNPPLRTVEDREALWEGIRKGVITLIATDHCPFSKGEKEAGYKNIWESKSGIPGVETLLPLMLTEGNKRGMSYAELVSLLCHNPARTFGLDHRKGFIKVGYDADLVIVDPRKKVVISADNMHTKCEYTPYENYTARGYPTRTIVRGKTVMEHGDIKSKPGTGKYVPSHSRQP